MTDTSTAQGGETTALSRLADFGTMLRRSDIALAVGMMAILVILILPLPPVLLDFSLAISITFSVLILMTSLFIQAPLEFSSFPTVLLIATMLRLALNLASTRLILAHGHEGTAAAGHVIQAFGNFVMGGNFVIGIIVFTILVIVNFVVITKGSGRIAEVAARFHLDSMPGKQMAIDADLNAGLIDEKDARRRRKALEDESGFFGAMDGASKFVRGDAIAGLLVVMINVIGGMIIGIVQQGLSFADAAQDYTLLTVGDGLVTQIPALIVSTAAGLLVSKAGVTGAADKALLSQFSSYPKALGMSAAVMLVMALLPGIPMIPFLMLGGGTAALAFTIDRRAKQVVTDEAKKVEIAKAAPVEEPIAASLKMDDLKIELGYALLPMVNGPDGSDRLTEQIKALRRSLATEMGFVMPAVRILDNVQLDANTYLIKIKEVEAGTGKVWHGQYMVMDPSGNQVTLPWHAHHRTDVRPAGDLDRRCAQGRGFGQRLDRRRCADGARHSSHRAHQGQHGRAFVLWRSAEIDQGTAEGTERIDQGHRAGTDHHFRHPARAANPARRTGLDPRSIDHPRGHRRRAARHAQRHDACRACARAPCAPALRPACDRGRHAADHRAHREMGAGLCRSRSSVKATIAASPCSRPSSPSSSTWCGRNSNRRRARARRRCWSPRPAFGRSCAASSNVSAHRPPCSHNRKSTRG